MTRPGDHLRLVGARCRADELTPDDRRWLANGIEAYFRGEVDLETAFETKLTRGHHVTAGQFETWRCLLATVAREQFPGLNSSQQAFKFYKGFHGYATTSWIRDRQEAQCPERLGRRQRDYWRILKLHERVPAERTIRAILAR
jgi:hypothetical protein